MRALLEAAGFTDIEENKDHTLNATRSGIRYKNMYLKDRSPGEITDTTITENVTMEYEYAPPEIKEIKDEVKN